MLTPAGNIVSLYGNELWDSFETTWGVGLNTFTSFNSGMPDKQWALSCNCAAGSALATPAQYAQPATYTITNGCVLCPAGYYTAASGATSCTACPVGFYSSAGSTSCNGCPSYTFSSDGAATCTPYVSSCPLGGSIVIYNVNLQKCLYHPSASVGSNGFSAFNSSSVFSYANCDSTNSLYLWTFVSGQFCSVTLGVCFDDPNFVIFNGNMSATGAIGLNSNSGTTDSAQQYVFTGQINTTGFIACKAAPSPTYIPDNQCLDSYTQNTPLFFQKYCNLNAPSQQWALSCLCYPGTYFVNGLCISATPGYYVANSGRGDKGT